MLAYAMIRGVDQIMGINPHEECLALSRGVRFDTEMAPFIEKREKEIFPFSIHREKRLIPK